MPDTVDASQLDIALLYDIRLIRLDSLSAFDGAQRIAPLLLDVGQVVAGVQLGADLVSTMTLDSTSAGWSLVAHGEVDADGLSRAVRQLSALGGGRTVIQVPALGIVLLAAMAEGDEPLAVVPISGAEFVSLRHDSVYNPRAVINALSNLAKSMR